MDGPVRGQSAAHWSGTVLGHGDGPVSVDHASRRQAGAGLRRPVLPAGMAAGPCADRLPVEPRRGQLEGRVGGIAVRGRGRRLWPRFPHGGGFGGVRTLAGGRPAQEPHRRGGSGGAGACRPGDRRERPPVTGAARIHRHRGAYRPGRCAPGIEMDPGGLSRDRRPLRQSDRPARRGGSGPDHLARRGAAGLGQSGVCARLAGRGGYRPRRPAGAEPDHGAGARGSRSRRSRGRALLQQSVRADGRGCRRSSHHRHL